MSGLPPVKKIGDFVLLRYHVESILESDRELEILRQRERKRKLGHEH